MQNACLASTGTRCCLQSTTHGVSAPNGEVQFWNSNYKSWAIKRFRIWLAAHNIASTKQIPTEKRIRTKSNITGADVPYPGSFCPINFQFSAKYSLFEIWKVWYLEVCCILYPLTRVKPDQLVQIGRLLSIFRMFQLHSTVDWDKMKHGSCSTTSVTIFYCLG